MFCNRKWCVMLRHFRYTRTVTQSTESCTIATRDASSLEKKSHCREGPKKYSRSQVTHNTWHVQSINCFLFYTNSPPQHKTPVFKHLKQPFSAQNVLLSKPKPDWFLENGPYTQQNIKDRHKCQTQFDTVFAARQPSFTHSCCVHTHQFKKKKKKKGWKTGSASAPTNTLTPAPLRVCLCGKKQPVSPGNLH